MIVDSHTHVVSGDERRYPMQCTATDPADPRQRRPAMGDQGIHERAPGVAGRRMHHQSGRLVDDDQMIVLVDDGEGDVFALQRRIGRRRHLDADRLAWFDSASRLQYRPAVDADLPVPDQRLHSRSAEVGQARGEQVIEPATPVRRRHMLATSVASVGSNLGGKGCAGGARPLPAGNPGRVTF